MPSYFRSFLFGSVTTTERSVQITILLLRLFTGLAFCTIFEKFMPRDGIWGPQAWFIEDVANMGFPFPVFFAWAAVLSEFFGGLLLIIGLFTRPAALLNLIVMMVATFLQHDGDISNKGLMSFTFLILCSSILLLGGGRISLDHFLQKRIILKPVLTSALLLVGISLYSIPLPAQNVQPPAMEEELVEFSLKNNSLIPRKYVIITYRPDKLGNQTRMPFFLPFAKRKFRLPVGSKVYAPSQQQVDIVMSGASIRNDPPLVLVEEATAGKSIKIRRKRD